MGHEAGEDQLADDVEQPELQAGVHPGEQAGGSTEPWSPTCGRGSPAASGDDPGNHGEQGMETDRSGGESAGLSSERALRLMLG